MTKKRAKQLRDYNNMVRNMLCDAIVDYENYLIRLMNEDSPKSPIRQGAR